MKATPFVVFVSFVVSRGKRANQGLRRIAASRLTASPGVRRKKKLTADDADERGWGTDSTAKNAGSAKKRGGSRR